MFYYETGLIIITRLRPLIYLDKILFKIWQGNASMYFDVIALLISKWLYAFIMSHDPRN